MASVEGRWHIVIARDGSVDIVLFLSKQNDKHEISILKVMQCWFLRQLNIHADLNKWTTALWNLYFKFCIWLKYVLMSMFFNRVKIWFTILVVISVLCTLRNGVAQIFEIFFHGRQGSGGRLNKKMASYQYKDSHYKIRPSHDRPIFVMANLYTWRNGPWNRDTHGIDLVLPEYPVSMMTSSNGNIFRATGPLCVEFTGSGEFPTQRPVTRSFDVFFDLRLNKRLSKQPWGWWFETPSWSGIMTSM